MIKMIIADDEQLIRESLASRINWQARGVEVVACCKNGIEALDTIVDLSPDLMLTDIRMPGLTGLELIEKIRERDKDVEVILLSGYKEFEYAQQALRLDVADYLLKPMRESQLFEAVDNAIKRHEKKQYLQKQSYKYTEPRSDTAGAGVVDKLKKYVLEHYSDPNLTLKWISENVLYMNVDYVSRRFVAETGNKFSGFLTQVRMENAMRLLCAGQEDLYAVAQRVGCGNSLRYFGQVFKKHTGFSPAQYLARQKVRA